MTLEAFQAFTNYWYAEAQAQTHAQVGQGQFPVPPTITFVPPLAQPVVKIFKLVNEARQLGCKTFSNFVDVVAAKN